MRVVLFFMVALVFCKKAIAQQTLFVYLQSENNATFYVKLNDRIMISSPAGYLLISGLPDNTYQVNIGFPTVKKEAKFSIPLKGKDRGFLIKYSGMASELYDIQTSVIIPSIVNEGIKGVSYRPRNDAFTFLLSKAANDTSLLYQAIELQTETIVQKSPEKKPEELKVVEEIKSKKEDMVVLIDTTVNKVTQSDDPEKNKIESINRGEKKELPKSIATGENDTKPNIKDQPAGSNNANLVEEFSRSVVKKHAESSTSEGFGLIFYDIYKEGTDTIRILIPNPKILFKKQDSEEDQHLDMLEIKKDTNQKVAAASKSLYPACKSIATSAQFLKLRKNMAAKKSDKGMVDEAIKNFKGTCFSTEQVRHLSTLFLTPEGKYLFFETAHHHVSDLEQFSSLEEEIRDEYYSKRFKNLVGK